MSMKLKVIQTKNASPYHYVYDFYRADDRRVLVSITEKGKDFVSRKKAECTSMMASLMEHLGEKDAEELIRLEKKAAMLLHRKNKANEF